MTTSPFGAPNQFGSAPQGQGGPPAATAPPAGSSRKPLLYTLGGVAVAAALGAGAFFVLSPGDSDEPVAAAPIPRGSSTAPEPETEVVVPDEPTLVTQSSRNPFAALVLPGGAGAAATTPEASSGGSGSTASSAGSSAGGSSGSAGSSAGAAGADGRNGRDGKNGKDGKNGANGADGSTPMYVTIQLVDIDEATNTVDAVVRTSLGETTPIDLAVGSPFDADAASPAGRVVYTAVGSDLDADGQIDFVTVTIDGAEYTVHTNETYLGFVYE